MNKTIFKILTIFILTYSTSLFADVCVSIDNSKDQLDESDRQSAKLYLEGTLEQEGEKIASGSCSEEYVLYHLKLGDTITAFINSPKGNRKLKAASINELPEVYSQMVRSIKNSNDADDMANANRKNVTESQANPRRIQADNLFYVRLGYGSLIDKDIDAGQGFGLGYRYELDNFAIDFSFVSLFLNSSKVDNARADISYLKIAGLYFFDSIAANSLYAGAGLSLGLTTVKEEDIQVSGDKEGLRAELTIGYEFLRASTIRFFLQGDVILPFYRNFGIKDWNGNYLDKQYIPSVVASIGIGF